MKRRTRRESRLKCLLAVSLVATFLNLTVVPGIPQIEFTLDPFQFSPFFDTGDPKLSFASSDDGQDFGRAVRMKGDGV